MPHLDIYFPRSRQKTYVKFAFFLCLYQLVSDVREHNLSPQKKHTVRIANSPPKKKQPINTPSSANSLRSTSFNPVLPKTAAYPRPPRKNESLLSVNGSPLMIPSSSYYANSADNSENSLERQLLNSSKDSAWSSNIIVRRDPSFMSLSFQEDTRYQPEASQPSSRSYISSQITQAESLNPNELSHHQQDSQPLIRPSVSAIIRVPTKDGHVLEFDPLLTSPEELDIVQGITDSAKKQAKEDMVRLVHSTLTKWKIS